jgi:hypothetical protein
MCECALLLNSTDARATVSPFAARPTLFAGGVTADDIRGLLDEPAAKARGRKAKALAEAA